MEHSAEFYRGAVEALEDLAIAFETPVLRLLALECRNRATNYRSLLAEAEAREALQGSKEKMALSHIYEIASRQLAEPAGAGDAVAMAKICTEVEAVHLPSEASVPTAAEVIAAAEKALEAWKYYVTLVGDDSVVKANLLAYPRASVINADALAAIAKWKEAKRLREEK